VCASLGSAGHSWTVSVALLVAPEVDVEVELEVGMEPDIVPVEATVVSVSLVVLRALDSVASSSPPSPDDNEAFVVLRTPAGSTLTQAADMRERTTTDARPLYACIIDFVLASVDDNHKSVAAEVMKKASSWANRNGRLDT
jgi:hypothetical protein